MLFLSILFIKESCKKKKLLKKSALWSQESIIFYSNISDFFQNHLKTSYWPQSLER